MRADTDLIIIGAGLSGLSTAYHLKRPFILFEKNTKYGGMASSDTVNGFVFDKTGHLLHFQTDYVSKLLRALANGSQLTRHNRSSWVFSNKTYTRYPFQVNTYKLPPPIIKDCLVKMAEAQTALTLLFEKTTDAQGQANREMDTAAARSERLKATITNLHAEIGEKLLPIFVDIVTFIAEDIVPAFQEFYEELTDPSGEAMQQMGAIGDAWMEFVSVFKFGSAEVKNQDVFQWIGDSVVSAIKALTHLSTFVGEIFSGMSKIFQATCLKKRRWDFIDVPSTEKRFSCIQVNR